MDLHHPLSLIVSQGSSPDGALLAPIIVLILDVAMIIYCLDDLKRRRIVTGGNKPFWAAVIILGSFLGQFIYLLYGRGEY